MILFFITIAHVASVHEPSGYDGYLIRQAVTTITNKVTTILFVINDLQFVFPRNDQRCSVSP